MTTNYVIPIGLFFLLVIKPDAALKCYYCKGGWNSVCANITGNASVNVVDCPSSNHVCYHHDYNVHGIYDYSQYVQRGCVSRSSIICPRLPLYTRCTICDIDYCNSNISHLKPGNNTNNSSSNLSPENNSSSKNGNNLGSTINHTFIYNLAVTLVTMIILF